MSSNIAALLKYTEIGITLQNVIKLATVVENDLYQGYEDLLGIDQEIGGVGLHNVHRPDGQWVTGNYRVELRPLFRPIQYVYRDLGHDDLVWEARHIVQWSCAHVEDAIKYRFKILESFNASLGVLLTQQPEIKDTLEPDLYEWLLNLNREVYRAAKHRVEELNIDAHRFTPADAISVYLMCRWAGVQLLKPTGLLEDWKRVD